MINIEVSESERLFLESQNISEYELFNAKGRPVSQCKQEMENHGKLFAYNTTPCRNYGHTLRSRSSHCIQCNTARIAFQRRHESAGMVYVAGSLKGSIIKIGYTKDVQIREESLNRTGYAGYYDWIVLFAIRSINAGEVESRLDMALKNYSYSLDYLHDGGVQEANEIFKCSYLKCRQAMLDICESYCNDYNIVIDLNKNEYDFRNLRRL